MTVFEFLNAFWTNFYETTLQWPFLVSAACVAIAYEHLIGSRSSKEVLQKVFHKDVWFHQSSFIDYKIAVINALIFTILVPQSIFASINISAETYSLLELVFGTRLPPAEGSPTLIITLLFSLVVLMLSDFASYVMHYMSHKIPFLWALHKVHHSAEVLTPMTTYRTHPVETMISLTLNFLFLGFCFGFLKYFINVPVAEMTLLGLNVFSFCIHLLGGLLTHSHIRLQWPRWLARIIISPQNHQIHHSNNPRHYDKNFGFWFSIWDVLFGTYYHGTKEDKYGFGIGEEGKLHLKLKGVYFSPVKESLSVLQKKFRKTSKPTP
jgi:sterol desaturase/sphingolipid hydroxylase (fatty acid hydroxylase superfamily)